MIKIYRDAVFILEKLFNSTIVAFKNTGNDFSTWLFSGNNIEIMPDLFCE
jgi:hypothetical protein